MQPGTISTRGLTRAFHLALVAAGGVLLVTLVRTIGLDRLALELRGFGTAFVGVVALELVLDGCNTLAWQRTLTPAAIGFWRLYWIRQAGTAVNQLTPTASFGGEVVKAMLLRPSVDAGNATASIVAAKLSFAMAQTLLVLCGLAALFSRLGGAPSLRAAVVFAAGATCVGVGGFFLLQRHGALSWTLDTLVRRGMGGERLDRFRTSVADIDARLATLHRERRGAFGLSVAWHFVAQLVGTLQLFYILHVLGVPASLVTCLAIEAFALVIDSALFFVPGRIGVQEGSRVLVFTALGMGAATGLAVAVIVRVDQLAVATLGLLAYGYFSLTSVPTAGSPSGTGSLADPCSVREPGSASRP
jgi:glycosyltransferase 2 family protein